MKSCRTCVYNIDNVCTVLPISVNNGQVKLIPESWLDRYFCKEYLSKPINTEQEEKSKNILME